MSQLLCLEALVVGFAWRALPLEARNPAVVDLHFQGQAELSAGLVLAGERRLFHPADAEEAPLVAGQGFDQKGPRSQNADPSRY